MNDCRWREFVEDSDGRGSASRLNMMIGVGIGSVVVLFLTFFKTLGGEIFGTYMLATGGIYGLGKWRETTTQIEQIRADSPNQPVPIVVPPPPAGPTTMIQVGTPAKTDVVKDVNIKAEGDVNVRNA